MMIAPNDLEEEQREVRGTERGEGGQWPGGVGVSQIFAANLLCNTLPGPHSQLLEQVPAFCAKVAKEHVFSSRRRKSGLQGLSGVIQALERGGQGRLDNRAAPQNG